MIAERIVFKSRSILFFFFFSLFFPPSNFILFLIDLVSRERRCTRIQTREGTKRRERANVLSFFFERTFSFEMKSRVKNHVPKERKKKKRTVPEPHLRRNLLLLGKRDDKRVRGMIRLCRKQKTRWRGKYR